MVNRNFHYSYEDIKKLNDKYENVKCQIEDLLDKSLDLYKRDHMFYEMTEGIEKHLKLLFEYLNKEKISPKAKKDLGNFSEGLSSMVRELLSNQYNIYNNILHEFQELHFIYSAVTSTIQIKTEKKIQKLKQSIKTKEKPNVLSEILSYINLISEQNTENYNIIRKNLQEIQILSSDLSSELNKALESIESFLPAECFPGYTKKTGKVSLKYNSLSNYIKNFLLAIEDFTGLKISMSQVNRTQEAFSDANNSGDLEALKAENQALMDQIINNEKNIEHLNRYCQELVEEISRQSFTLGDIKKNLERIAAKGSKSFLCACGSALSSVSKVFDEHLETLKYYIKIRERKTKEFQTKSFDVEELNQLNACLISEIESFQAEVAKLRNFDQISQENYSKDRSNTQYKLIEELRSVNSMLTRQVKSLQQAKNPSQQPDTYKEYKKQTCTLLNNLISEKKDLKIFTKDKFDVFQNEFKQIVSEIMIKIELQKTKSIKILPKPSKIPSFNKKNKDVNEFLNLESKMTAVELQDLKKENEKLNNSLKSSENSIENYEKFIKSLLLILPSSVEKTPLGIKKYFYSLKSVFDGLSSELNEENPENFIDRIGDFKEERDSSYLEVQRLSDVLNEIYEYTGLSSSQILNYIKNNSNVCKQACLQITQFYEDKTQELATKAAKVLQNSSKKIQSLTKSFKTLKSLH